MTERTVAPSRGAGGDRVPRDDRSVRTRPVPRTRPVRAGPHAAPPPIDPRIRARRLAVAREAARRHRRVVVAALVVTAVVAVAVGAVYSPLLAVDHIRITGATQTGSAAVLDAAGVDLGDPLLRVGLGGVEDRVGRLPWVARVTAARDLPHTLRIQVVERVAVGWTPLPGGAALVDRSGRVLARSASPPEGLPELAAAGPVAVLGRRVHPAASARLVAALPPDLAARTLKATVGDGAATLELGGGPQVRLGAPVDVAAKARVAAAVLATLGSTPVAYVDVRVPQAPVTG
jgi:cell division protein FtsQ